MMTRAEKIVWIFFAATSLQLAFQQPSVILVPGERTNLFSGLLCFVTLVVAVLFRRKGAINLKSPEFLVSIALAAMAVLSGLYSITPFSSSLRVFALLASGLGGFWCARLLLDTPANQRRFEWLCLFLLAGIVLLSLAGYYASRRIYDWGMIFYYLGAAPHAITNLILLLSFAPIGLLGQKSRPLILVAIILLVLSFAALCLSQRLSVIFIPIVLAVLGVVWGVLRLKHLLLVLIPMVLLIGYYSPDILWSKLTNKAHNQYRLENYAFSWHIAKHHPIFGIGVRAPREKFLEDYQLRYSIASKEHFAQNVGDIVSADNIILTFLAGLGFPFVITYCSAVIILVVKLVGLASNPPPGLYFPPLLLLFPITVGLVHFQLYDGLLFPQNSWFFHIFLGLIPLRARSQEGQGGIWAQTSSISPFEPTTRENAEAMGTGPQGNH